MGLVWGGHGGGGLYDLLCCGAGDERRVFLSMFVRVFWQTAPLRVGVLVLVMPQIQGRYDRACFEFVAADRNACWRYTE